MTIVINGDTGLTGVPSISGTATNTAITLADNSSNTNTCRAWVSFTGVTTVTISGFFNVSSVTRSSSGTYVANFSVAMPSSTYAVVGSCSKTGGNVVFYWTTRTTTSCGMTCSYTSTGTNTDTDINFLVFN